MQKAGDNIPRLCSVKPLQLPSLIQLSSSLPRCLSQSPSQFDHRCGLRRKHLLPVQNLPFVHGYERFLDSARDVVFFLAFFKPDHFYLTNCKVWFFLKNLHKADHFFSLLSIDLFLRLAPAFLPSSRHTVNRHIMILLSVYFIL